MLVEQGGGPLVHVIRLREGLSAAPQGQLGQPQALVPGCAGRGDAEAGGGDGAQRLRVQIVVILGDLQAVLIHVAVQLQDVPLE